MVNDFTICGWLGPSVVSNVTYFEYMPTKYQRQRNVLFSRLRRDTCNDAPVIYTDTKQDSPVSSITKKLSLPFSLSLLRTPSCSLTAI